MTPIVVLTCFVLAQQAAAPCGGPAVDRALAADIVASLESVDGRCDRPRRAVGGRDPPR